MKSVPLLLKNKRFNNQTVVEGVWTNVDHFCMAKVIGDVTFWAHEGAGDKYKWFLETSSTGEVIDEGQVHLPEGARSLKSSMMKVWAGVKAAQDAADNRFAELVRKEMNSKTMINYISDKSIKLLQAVEAQKKKDAEIAAVVDDLKSLGITGSELHRHLLAMYKVAASYLSAKPVLGWPEVDKHLGEFVIAELFSGD